MRSLARLGCLGGTFQRVAGNHLQEWLIGMSHHRATHRPKNLYRGDDGQSAIPAKTEHNEITEYSRQNTHGGLCVAVRGPSRRSRPPPGCCVVTLDQVLEPAPVRNPQGNRPLIVWGEINPGAVNARFGLFLEICGHRDLNQRNRMAKARHSGSQTAEGREMLGSIDSRPKDLNGTIANACSWNPPFAAGTA